MLKPVLHGSTCLNKTRKNFGDLAALDVKFIPFWYITSQRLKLTNNHTEAIKFIS